MPQILFEYAAEPRCPEAWSRTLSDRLERPVRLTYGRARRNVVVARSHGRRLEVRLNEGFATAPPEVAEALTDWLRSGKRARRACATLDRWVAELGERLGPPARRTVRIRARGEHHDLRPLARAVIEQQFSGELDASWCERVTWGRRARRANGGRRRARRSLQLGSFDPETEVIRVHPVLDQPAVPGFFVSYVLFHELLHATQRDEDHGRPHPPEFVARERAYPDLQRALRWQEEHVAALIDSARAETRVRIR